MRKITVLLLFLSFLGFLVSTAEAARFGGGRSFGMQRSVSSFSRYQPPSAGYAQRASRNSWAAPLAGLALGSMLGYLLMGHGFSSGIFSWLAMLSIVFVIWSLLRGKLQAVAQTMHRGQGRVFDADPSYSRVNYASGSASGMQNPTNFDAEAFLREAKVQFIRLQAAYDAKDLGDLREFTGPEVFAEIQLQLQERGQKPNHTEVVSLNAELVDLHSENQTLLAAVKFKGLIQENASEPAKPFEEFWHFRKDIFREKWLVMGVQQNLH